MKRKLPVQNCFLILIDGRLQGYECNIASCQEEKQDENKPKTATKTQTFVKDVI